MDVLEYFVLILELVGTEAFAISGSMVGIRRGMDLFGVCVLGVITGTGGGLLRDLFAGTPPYIFVKHIYACASMLGAVACFVLWDTSRNLAMLAGCCLTLVIRVLAAHYQWSLPKIRDGVLRS